MSGFTDQEIEERVREALGAFADAYLGQGTTTRYLLDGLTLVNSDKATAPGPSVMQWELPVAAEKILLSESTVRIFGLTGAPGKTVKIKLSKRPWEYLWGRDPSTLLPGIRAARIASALGSPIQIPGAKAYDRRGRWLVEDVIDGRRLTRPEIAEFLADALLPFYRRTMRPRPLRRVKAARKLIDDLEGMGVESPISALDNLLPFVLGHGDISSNNVLRTPDGGYALIDWDGAAVIPAAFDLAELCAHLDVSVAQGGQSTGQDDDD